MAFSAVYFRFLTSLKHIALRRTVFFGKIWTLVYVGCSTVLFFLWPLTKPKKPKQSNTVLPLDRYVLQQTVLSGSVCLQENVQHCKVLDATHGRICSTAACAVPGGGWPTSACASSVQSVKQESVMC